MGSGWAGGSSSGDSTRPRWLPPGYISDCSGTCAIASMSDTNVFTADSQNGRCYGMIKLEAVFFGKQ
eukprot:scaffold52613_cov55-Phaeocystis_antarctica.AAC.4